VEKKKRHRSSNGGGWKRVGRDFERRLMVGSQAETSSENWRELNI